MINEGYEGYAWLVGQLNGGGSYVYELVEVEKSTEKTASLKKRSEKSLVKRTERDDLYLQEVDAKLEAARRTLELYRVEKAEVEERFAELSEKFRNALSNFKEAEAEFLDFQSK